MAYSPKAVAFTTGVAGAVLSPNKWVAVLFVVGSSAIDTLSTFWSRYQEHRRQRDGD
ncbi:hypothetical protein AB0M02_36470 [Actinoplanes sp. NPDC051861]|uniref:hypothetical protein n=1 Tax=Actinoplanes sp. NPDC051861 TaxID=3155170 RepID=UPI0034240AF2